MGRRDGAGEGREGKGKKGKVNGEGREKIREAMERLKRKNGAVDVLPDLVFWVPYISVSIDVHYYTPFLHFQKAHNCT